MLNVYISADLEGTNGVTYFHQTMPSGGDSYTTAVKQQQEELNCIVETLIKLNADKITINDAHGSMENLKLSSLNPNIQLITGKPKPVSMMAGLDETYSCVIMTGYHAKADSREGVLAHTISTIFKSVKLNGDFVGEIELNAISAGLKNIPVIIVTGDNIACDEASHIIKNITTVCTKTAISYTAAVCKPNKELFNELQTAIPTALKNQENWILYKKNPPYTLEVGFVDRKHADIAEFIPGVERTSASEIEFISEDFEEVYKLLQFFAATLLN